MQEGCGCHRGSTGGQCCNDVLLATGLKNLYNCLELSRVELDLVILTNIQAFTPSEAMPGEKIKNNPPYSFQYQALPICKEMFLNLHGISKSCFQKLLDHTKIMVFQCGYMETAEGYHITYYHRPWLRASRTFGAILQRKMHFCFQEESLASKTKTFSYSHPVTGRCEYGTHLKVSLDFWNLHTVSHRHIKLCRDI